MSLIGVRQGPSRAELEREAAWAEKRRGKLSSREVNELLKVFEQTRKRGEITQIEYERMREHVLDRLYIPGRPFPLVPREQAMAEWRARWGDLPR